MDRGKKNKWNRLNKNEMKRQEGKKGRKEGYIVWAFCLLAAGWLLSLFLCNLFLLAFPFFFLIPPPIVSIATWKIETHQHTWFRLMPTDALPPSASQLLPPAPAPSAAPREEEKKTHHHYLHAQTHKQTRPTRKRDPRLLGWKTHFSTYYYFFFYFYFFKRKKKIIIFQI